MPDRTASAASYASSAAVVVAGWGVNEWAVLFGMFMAAMTYLYNRRHKERMAKQDEDYKREMLKILREKSTVTINPSINSDEE